MLLSGPLTKAHLLLKNLSPKKDPPEVALVIGIIGAIIKHEEGQPKKPVPPGPGFPCNIDFVAAKDTFQGGGYFFRQEERGTIISLRAPGGPYDVRRESGEVQLLSRSDLQFAGCLTPHSKPWQKLHRCAARMADQQKQSSQ